MLSVTLFAAIGYRLSAIAMRFAGKGSTILAPQIPNSGFSLLAICHLSFVICNALRQSGWLYRRLGSNRQVFSSPKREAGD